MAAINESLHVFISSLSSKAEAAMSVALDIPLDTVVVERESVCVRERGSECEIVCVRELENVCE